MIQTAKVPTNCTMTEVATSWIRGMIEERSAGASTRPSTTLPALTSEQRRDDLAGATIAPAAAAPTASR